MNTSFNFNIRPNKLPTESNTEQSGQNSEEVELGLVF